MDFDSEAAELVLHINFTRGLALFRAPPLNCAMPYKSTRTTCVTPSIFLHLMAQRSHISAWYATTAAGLSASVSEFPTIVPTTLSSGFVRAMSAALIGTGN